MVAVQKLDQSELRAACRISPVGPTPRHSWLVPWGLATLAFPLASIFYAAAGFLVGLPVGRWQGVCGLITSLMLCVPGPGNARKKIRKMALVLGVIAFSVTLAGLSVMYSNPDAEMYHRPAAMLIASGWNPVFDSTAETVENFQVPGQRFHVFHVAFMPRAAWIFGAVLYRTVGFVEAADAFNVLACIVSFSTVSRLLCRVLGLTALVRHAAAAVIIMAPTVVSLAFGGMCDGGCYSLFLIASSAATLYLVSGGRQWLGFVSAAFPLMANLKFTGVVCCGVLATVFLVGCLQAWRSERAGPSRTAGWCLAVGASIGLAAVIGFSPYVTSWVRFGGPFYPVHSFDKRVTASTRIFSGDMLAMNEDAQRMGYLGRFGYAYISQPLTLATYGKGADGGNFTPTFFNYDMGGMGTIFRFTFVLSLLLLPFAKVGRLGFMLTSILLSVLLQPTMYIGYARYVPQFYAFPPLVLLAASRRLGDVLLGLKHGSRSPRLVRQVVAVTVAALAGCYSLPMLARPLAGRGQQWVTSVQNLEIIKAMKKDPNPFLLAGTYYVHRAFEDDYGCRNITYLDGPSDPRVAGRHRYASHSWTGYYGYAYLPVTPIDGFPELHRISSDDGPTLIYQPNQPSIAFFLFSFLPRQLPRLPIYLFDVASLRCRQCAHAWMASDDARGAGRD